MTDTLLQYKFLPKQAPLHSSIV